MLDADALDWAQALEILAWQAEMGATEALAETPVDRFALSETEAQAVRERAAPPAPAAPGPATGAPPPIAPAESPLDRAAKLARGAETLEALAEAMAGFDGCELKFGARNFVFADGRPGARVMIVGEAPGAEEDRTGLPFVGPAGQLLDRMFAAIGLRRDHPDAEHALYITNAINWRPPGNRTPTEDEIAVMRPFLARHVELAAPRVLVLLGNAACQAVLGRQGIMRLRGQWVEGFGLPALPSFHPSALLRRPEWKRDAWADMLTLQARLREVR